MKKGFNVWARTTSPCMKVLPFLISLFLAAAVMFYIEPVYVSRLMDFPYFTIKKQYD